MKTFDYNSTDGKGKTPLDYANEQDSGKLASVLKKAKAKTAGGRERRMPTSAIGAVDWIEEELDYEADA